MIFATGDELSLAPQPGAQSLSIPVLLNCRADCDSSQPITFGVPLPKGKLHNASAFWLRDQRGGMTTAQGRVLARWSDGSVKWLLIDGIVPPIRRGRSAWTLGVSEQEAIVCEALAHPLPAVHSTDHDVTVEGSPITARFSRQGDGSLCRLQTFDERNWNLISAFLTHSNGAVHAAKVNAVEVEEQGHVRTTIALQGVFPRSRGLRFQARICLFGSTGLARLQFTVHNPNPARHPGGLWDLGDPGSFLFRDLSIVLTPSRMPSQVNWQTEPGQPVRGNQEGTLEIYQDSSGGPNWNSRNHVNREGRVPCRFPGYQVTSSDGPESGRRAQPVVSTSSADSSTTVTVAKFWQQFPKSLSCTAGEIRIGLFPKQWDDLFELQGGEQKTHTVWFHFGDGASEGIEALPWVHEPVQASASPRWIADSNALGPFLPQTEDADSRMECFMAEVLDGPRSIPAGQERIDEYGWRNYGDVHADHEEAFYNGPRPVISHYNNQFDVLYGLVLHFLRSSDIRYFELLAPLAQHVLDIDIYHTDRDRQAYNGGLFWFTDHYLDAATSSHRTYSSANRPAGGAPYGGGPGCEHNFTTGLLHYYYLTGDRQALDATMQLAEWVLQMDDGRKNLLGLLDSGPTGLATGSANAVCHRPGRGAANSVNALVDGWLASGQRRFLDQAESLIRRVIHPHDDVPGRGLLDAEKYWSYTMFLTSLARYLSVKAEADELDAMYSYGRASLLTYAQWMVDHERPYFDRAEELEYPTEAWAAQEFRKANVFRLAAEHASGKLRDRLIERGEEFAERAWTDLLRFESRFTARSVAIVMTEGLKDQFYRARTPVSFPEPLERHADERPEPFLPQRLRVRAGLRSARGLWGFSFNLLRIETWRHASLRL